MPAIKRSKTWQISSVISETVKEDERYVRNVEDLLRSDHTIPFIARYRKGMTGDMNTEKLYKIKEQLQHLDNLVKKIDKSICDIDKLGCLTPHLSEAIVGCTSSAMLEQVTAAYKPGKKKSRAEQARTLGLGPLAEDLINGKQVHFSSLVGTNENLKSIKSVVDGTRDILVEAVRTNKFVLVWCERVSKAKDNIIECSKSKSKAGTDDKKEKFDQYFDFTRNVGSLKHFQVMAINRGESLKALSVKITIAQHAQHMIKHQCRKALDKVSDSNLRNETVEDACSRLIFPLVCRRIRSSLTEAAVDSSLDVFADNLKHLLLTRPVKGIKVMALDPGYTHGCKVAILDRQGAVLRTDVVYLQQSRGAGSKASRFSERDEVKLQQLQSDHGFNTIAIGNGTGCRETERAVAGMINDKRLGEGTKYTVVDERGASVYSVTPLAVRELPTLDTNLRSAVSIGRRVLDPLSEYVKIEPQHLGVGQYQHDIAQTKLSARLEHVVTEAVCFTGLDVNTCGHHMLQKIAGLTKARAQAIIDTRQSIGQFVNRDQIRSIKGIGPKSYEQCIGFLRVYINQLTGDSYNNKNSTEIAAAPAAVPGKRKLTGGKGGKSKVAKLDVCYLDQTSVHPESYHIARSLIKDQGLRMEDIGSESFARTIKQLNPGSIAVPCDEGTKNCIISALSQTTDTDYRDQFARPLFKSEITCADSLTLGTELEGRVSNVTHFGAFVDVGLERDGLIHISKMRGFSVCLGNRVRVSVEKRDHKGIGLTLLQILE